MTRTKAAILFVVWVFLSSKFQARGVEVGSQGDGEPEQIGEDHATLATVLDHALEAEFTNDDLTAGKTYNETLQNQQGAVETVIKVSHGTKKQQAEQQEDANNKPLVPGLNNTSVFVASAATGNTPSSLPVDEGSYDEDNEVLEQDVDRVIDSKDNVFVLSRPADPKQLTIDGTLVYDLSTLAASAGVFGSLFEAFKQPSINGYLIAGSLIGPGGFNLITELVQVESVAQIGTLLLLFGLGLEFNLQRVQQIGAVAVVGGVVQVAAYVMLTGLAAKIIGGKVALGLFVGGLVAMSSTSVVIKCMDQHKNTLGRYTQVIIGILIVQDCMLGLMFPLLPVLQATQTGQQQSAFEVTLLLIKIASKLCAMLCLVAIVQRGLLPWALQSALKHLSPEVQQLLAVGFCLTASWCSGAVGLSAELGSFVAGAAIGGTEYHEQVYNIIQQTQQLFVALFLTSIGLVMSPKFLWHHIRVITTGLLIVLLSKSLVFALVALAFRLPLHTAMAVGVTLSQIGEFGFILLSIAAQTGLIPNQLALFLLGVAALSLMLTPLLIRMVVRWVPIETLLPEMLDIEQVVSANVGEQQLLLQSYTVAQKGLRGGINSSDPRHSRSTQPSSHKVGFIKSKDQF